MNYRTTTLLAAADQTDGAGTKIIDVNIAQCISRIEIRWRITKKTVSMTSYPHKDITKIELVDGSDVLFSMDGGQCQALCIFDRKAPTMNEGTFVDEVAQDSYYGIDFGRYLFDPLLAFDPTKFRNPQLKITYDEDVSDTGSSANELEVWAECFDEKEVLPIGFLMSKMHHSYTIGSENSYEYIDLPTDHILRRMLIQGYYSKKYPDYTVKEARLDEDNDKRVVFDWELGKYWVYRKAFDPPVIEPVSTYAASGGVELFLTPTNYWASILLVPYSSTAVDYHLVDAAGAASGQGGYFKLLVQSGVGTPSVRGIAQGWCPNHCFNFPFGNPQDPDDWYDVTKVGHLRLRLKAGAAGGTGVASAILQQLRRY